MRDTFFYPASHSAHLLLIACHRVANLLQRLLAKNKKLVNIQYLAKI